MIKYALLCTTTLSLILTSCKQEKDTFSIVTNSGYKISIRPQSNYSAINDDSIMYSRKYKPPIDRAQPNIDFSFLSNYERPLNQFFFDSLGNFFVLIIKDSVGIVSLDYSEQSFHKQIYWGVSLDSLLSIDCYKSEDDSLVEGMHEIYYKTVQRDSSVEMYYEHLKLYRLKNFQYRFCFNYLIHDTKEINRVRKIAREVANSIKIEN